jgi:hypothetical protein
LAHFSTWGSDDNEWLNLFLRRAPKTYKITAEKEVPKHSPKLWVLYSETVGYEARPNPNGRKLALSAGQLERTARKIDRQPYATLRELIDELNLPVCVSDLCSTVSKKLGYRFKKLCINT